LVHFPPFWYVVRRKIWQPWIWHFWTQTIKLLWILFFCFLPEIGTCDPPYDDSNRSSCSPSCEV
jgi:hypothetical protein